MTETALRNHKRPRLRDALVAALGGRAPVDPDMAWEILNAWDEDRYPKGAVGTAISALELAVAELREKPAYEELISDALDRLYRAREISEKIPHPYRNPVSAA